VPSRAVPSLGGAVGPGKEGPGLDMQRGMKHFAAGALL
jgi:hypothetical protein